MTKTPFLGARSPLKYSYFGAKGTFRNFRVLPTKNGSRKIIPKSVPFGKIWQQELRENNQIHHHASHVLGDIGIQQINSTTFDYENVREEYPPPTPGQATGSNFIKIMDIRGRGRPKF